MTRMPRLLLLLSWVFCSALATSIQGRISWNEHCVGAAELGPAQVLLDDGRLRGGVTKDGRFTIPDVPPGSYILSVQAHDHLFDHLRVDVPDAGGAAAAPRVYPYVPGTPFGSAAGVALPYPVALVPRARYDYHVAAKTFSLLAMLQSPMILMMVALAALALATPYLLKHMDPEVLHEMQRGQSDVAKMRQSLLGGDAQPNAAPSNPNAGTAPPAGAKPPSSSTPTRRNRKR